MKLIRYTSVLTAFLMLATAVQPVPAAAVPFAGAAAVSAAEEEPVAADTIGETIRWQLDADGVLTVTGSGDMADVNGNAFGSNAAKIKSAVIRNTDSKQVITAIGSGMFRGCTALESVTLPETVVSIGEDAFYGCTALTAFSFPKSLKEIGKNSFHSSGLTAAELPGCALGWGAFYACAGLKTVTIGEGTETIPAECFRKCAALESVTLPDSVKEINCGGFAEQGAFSECAALKAVSIGKGIETIHQNAFRTTGEGLEVTFREGVTAVPAEAFRYRTELAKVVLPDTLTSVGESAFQGCTALTACAFPKSLKEIGKNGFHSSGLTAAELPGCTLGWGAFYACAGLKTVTIGEGTEIIPAECFRKCAALESVTLPDSVKEINCGGFTEQGAFSECPELKTVSIGKGIETIHQNAFRTRGEGLEVTFREGVTAVPAEAFKYRTELAKVVLPDTLTSVGASAFEGCSALTDCAFPTSLKEIGQSGFQGSGLTAAELPGCTLGKGAFYACADLKTVTIGEGTETIPAECFRKCAALESVTLPDSVKEINCGGFTEQGAFSECPELKTVSIGKGIESIHQNAFRTTGEELEVVFRKGTAAIPDHAFDNAPVTKIILPRSVEEISANAVAGCASLKEILIQAPECVIADSAKAIPADAVIRSYEGSTPQTHAEKYEYKFVKLLLPGDLNDDGAVSADDAQMTLKAYTERIAGNDMKLTEDQILAADVDEDGALSVEDAQFILKYYTAKTVAQKDITWDDILNPSAKQS